MSQRRAAVDRIAAADDRQRALRVRPHSISIRPRRGSQRTVLLAVENAACAPSPYSPPHAGSATHTVHRHPATAAAALNPAAVMLKRHTGQGWARCQRAEVAAVDQNTRPAASVDVYHSCHYIARGIGVGRRSPGANSAPPSIGVHCYAVAVGRMTGSKVIRWPVLDPRPSRSQSRQLNLRGTFSTGNRGEKCDVAFCSSSLQGTAIAWKASISDREIGNHQPPPLTSRLLRIDPYSAYSVRLHWSAQQSLARLLVANALDSLLDGHETARRLLPIQPTGCLCPALLAAKTKHPALRKSDAGESSAAAGMVEVPSACLPELAERMEKTGGLTSSPAHRPALENAVVEAAASGSRHIAKRGVGI